MAAFLVIVPQHATGQPQEMSYFASDEEVAAANCQFDAAEEQRTGSLNDIDTNFGDNLHGRYVPYYDDDAGALITSAVQRTLFFIEIDKGSHFYRSAGGNAFVTGHLVAWDNSWLFCLKGGSRYFDWVDVSKPYLRIFPEPETLNSDGYYARFRIQEYWRETDPMLSTMPMFGNNWVLQTCDGGVVCG